MCLVGVSKMRISPTTLDEMEHSGFTFSGRGCGTLISAYLFTGPGCTMHDAFLPRNPCPCRRRGVFLHASTLTNFSVSKVHFVEAVKFIKNDNLNIQIFEQ